ncbi:helix-turn-helix transcriptional regulator [Cellulomonas denverensis]|uniref:helix-turn-helix transcriptional regulator n=1 Tax=Cellulomonas denverensis TaxID=264297 RepID=UPI0035E8F8FA
MAQVTHRGGSAFLHDEVLAAALRRLRTHRDVVLIGDTGSGRSTVLAQLAERLRAAGSAVVELAGLVSARGLPLGVFGVHPVLRPRAGARYGLPEAVAALGTALGTGPAAVLLDDPHLLDDVSAAAVAAVLRRRPARVSVVLGAPQGVDLPELAPDLARGAAVVRIEPMTISATAALLAEELDGPADGGLVATVLGRCGGNPRVALDLVDAAREAGAVGRVRGRWAQTGVLDLVRVDAVVHDLLADLPGDQREALDLLAWLGLVDLDTARRLAGTRTLSALDAAGRIAVQPSGQDHLVAVSPPALGQALRLRMTPTARAAVRERADQVLGSDRIGPATSGLPESAHLSAQPPFQAAQDQTAILTESVRTQAARHLRVWEDRRDVAAALPVLRLRLLDGLASIGVDEIFAGTAATSADDPDDLGIYLLLRAQWAGCRGRSVREAFTVDPGPSGALAMPETPEPFLDLLDALYQARIWPADQLAALDDRDVPPSLRDLVLIWRGRLAIEEGSPDRALDLLGGWRPSSGHRPFAHQLDALRGDALLLAGQVEDAVAWARDRLSAASAELSMFGVRLAARGLASALFVAGEHDEALRVLGVLLGAGRCGPVQSPYDERILALAAVGHALRDEHDLADVLLDELARTPRPYQPVLDVLDPWARGEVAYVRTGTAGSADGEAMWAACERLYQAGRRTSALLCWALAPLVLDDERLRRLEDLAGATAVAALTPVLRLNRAIARGSADQVLAAVAALRVPGPLIQVAIDTAARRGGTADGIADAGGPLAVDAVRRGRERRAPLTGREQEVVALARDGLTNRQIASRLYLSVRTVESHLYRAMQKLGVTDRARLADLPGD